MSRLFAILQLCFVFSLILWVLAVPFTVDHFNTHSSLLLYQTATGRGDRFISPEKLERHAERFAHLPPERQQAILRGYDALEAHAQRSFLSTLGDAIKGLLWDLPAFLQAWILFSFVICLMLLLSIEGALNAMWLLPIIALCYAVDNQSHGVPPRVSVDAVLLPSEDELLDHFGTGDRSYEGLKNAWGLYLIDVWAQETTEHQVEAGEHALTVARVERRLAEDTSQAPFTRAGTKKPHLLLWLFCSWNVLVAFAVQKSRRRPAEAKRVSAT